MSRKNNKKNRRRATFYRISKFDYEMREKLTEGKSLLKEIPQEEKVEYSSENAWTKAWTSKITII